MKLRSAVACVTLAAFLCSTAARADDVRLLVQSDNPAVRVQKLAGVLDVTVGSESGSGELWTDVCSAPCGSEVPRDATLRIVGDDVAPAQFSVADANGPANVTVKAGSQTRRAVGGLLAIVGAGFVLSGGAALASASAFDAPADLAAADPALNGAADSARTVGIVSLIAGAVSLLAGSFVLVNSPGTAVSVN